MSIIIVSLSDIALVNCSRSGERLSCIGSYSRCNLATKYHWWSSLAARRAVAVASYINETAFSIFMAQDDCRLIRAFNIVYNVTGQYTSQCCGHGMSGSTKFCDDFYWEPEFVDLWWCHIRQWTRVSSFRASLMTKVAVNVMFGYHRSGTAILKDHQEYDHSPYLSNVRNYQHHLLRRVRECCRVKDVCDNWQKVITSQNKSCTPVE